MNFIDLKSSLTEPKKVYLLEGEDAFFRNRAKQILFDKFLSEPDFNLTKFDGTVLKGNLSPLVGSLDLCPLLGQYRIIFINEWYPTAQDLKNKDINAYFNGELGCTMMIISNRQKCDALKKQSAVEVVDCKKADADLIVRYLQSETKKHNIVISRRCCELIAEYSLFDMTKISNEIQKIISFVSDNGIIDEDVINKLVVKETDYKIYEMVSFIVDKKHDKAFEVLNELSSLGDQQILLVSLYNHFRRLLFVSISNQTDDELSEMLGVKKYAVTMARRQAAKFSAKRLMKIINVLTEADSAFKSGKCTLSSALDTAVFNILQD